MTTLLWRFTGLSVTPSLRGKWIKGTEACLTDRYAEARFQAILATLKNLSFGLSSSEIRRDGEADLTILPESNGRMPITEGKIVKDARQIVEVQGDEPETQVETLAQPIKVLDLGAGHGYLSFRLAERLSGTFLMMEGHLQLSVVLIDSCLQNDNPQTYFLFYPFTLKTLEAFLQKEPVDVILAINILHLFPDPWNEVLAVLTRYCRMVILEHLAPYEKAASLRVVQEPLDLRAYQVTSLGFYPTPEPGELARRELLAISGAQQDLVIKPGIAASTFRVFGGSYPRINPRWLKGKSTQCRIIRGKVVEETHSSKKR